MKSKNFFKIYDASSLFCHDGYVIVPSFVFIVFDDRYQLIFSESVLYHILFFYSIEKRQPIRFCALVTNKNTN